MLLAVEGGGFFSSSASGYTKGLTLLLFGQRNEERPMRVSPWNQYQLVEQEVDSDLQLASRKKRTSCRCTFFICFGRPSAGGDGPCPPKLGSVQQPRSLPDTSAASDTDNLTSTDVLDDNRGEVCLKSNLKKLSANCSVTSGEVDGAHNSLDVVQTNKSCSAERRKVQWPDACGRELAEIREFEVSDEGASEEELEHGVRRCECVIQ